MKIGIDISQIVYGTGVSYYTQNLTEALLKIDKKNEYIFFGSALRAKSFLEDYLRKLKGDFQGKIYSFPPLFLERLWNQLHLVNIEIFTGGLDLFHTSDWLEPPSLCPKVTTIHDLSVFKYPEAFTPKGGHNIVVNMRKKLEWVKKESARIIAVSKSTKKDIIEILGIPEEKVRVIYEAAPAEFKKATPGLIKQVIKKFKIKKDFLLAVGTLEPRKNLKRVVQAYRSFKNSKDWQLVLVGRIGWGESLKAGPGIILTGCVPHQELVALYSSAGCLVYPSLYEGFGQPILEAMNRGCPVVTSNVSSMPEVAGEAAVLVDPLSVKNISEGIKQALENRDELVKKGYQQVKKFSWEKCARETLKVYEEVVGQN